MSTLDENLISLDPEELNAVIAGLRLLQALRERSIMVWEEQAEAIAAIEGDSGTTLDDDSLERLVQFLNS